MKARLAQQPSKDSSAAVAAWLQVAWSPALVGLFLAVLIVLLAWPRLTGPPWAALRMPFDLRESEGNTVQWEQIHYFNALRATLRADMRSMIEGRYSTDDYRAMLPIYISAIFSWWLDSSYKGMLLVDLFGWWIASWALYHLAWRLGASHLSALTAAVLLAVSPLLIAFMGWQVLHVMQSASLVPCFLAALLLLTDNRLAHGWRVTGLAGVFYVASLIYQYQWIIIPCLLSLAIVERRKWRWVFSIIMSSILFVVITFLTYRILDTVALSVAAFSNDPLTVVISRFTYALESGFPEVERLLLPLVRIQIRSYHLLIISLSVLGFAFASAKLRILVLTGAILGLASSYFHPGSWVAMNGYPFVYISAGLALVEGPRWLADFIARMGSGRYPQFAAQITSGSELLAKLSTVVLLLLALWSTNGDLFGDYNFAQQWWDFTYVPT